MIDRPPLAWRPVGAVAGVAALVLLLTINRYDYHRDELYFRMVGAHPKWGYVDQPPFTPLLVRACVDLFGDTVWAIRLPGVLFLAAAAILLACVAREVGGGPLAQTLASTGVITTFPRSPTTFRSSRWPTHWRRTRATTPGSRSFRYS